MTLEGTRENDARVAVAMGTPWMKPRHGNCCTCQTCGWPHDECKCGWVEDPALVVPMMRRLAELAAWLDCATLRVWPDGSAECWVEREDATEHAFSGGPTANLAVAAALLAVWEGVNP